MEILKLLVALATPFGICIVSIIVIAYVIHRGFNHMDKQSALGKLNVEYLKRIEDLSIKLEKTTESYNRVTKALDTTNEQLILERTKNAPLINLYYEILMQYAENVKQSVQHQSPSNMTNPD